MQKQLKKIHRTFGGWGEKPRTKGILLYICEKSGYFFSWYTSNF